MENLIFYNKPPPSNKPPGGLIEIQEKVENETVLNNPPGGKSHWGTLLESDLYCEKLLTWIKRDVFVFIGFWPFLKHNYGNLANFLHNYRGQWNALFELDGTS